MYGDVEKAAIVSGPLNGTSGGAQRYSATDASNRAEVRNITVSTTTGQVDLNDAFGTNANGAPLWFGRFLRITCTVAFDLYWSDVPTDTCAYQAADATTPNIHGEHWPADFVDQVIPGGRYLIWDASGSGILSLSLRSPAMVTT